MKHEKANKLMTFHDNNIMLIVECCVDFLGVKLSSCLSLLYIAN